ncbi:MAG TPA: VOC family protein [Chitinophagaceae bacterium]|nr:VOC family protein [Chitinophagaceae bacterium]
MQRITPFLWFNREAEEAARFYTSVFPRSRVINTTHYDEAGARVSGMDAGSVMTVDFELDGQSFAAINGGPQFRFTEAVSFVVNCGSQEEIDYYWERLCEDGDPRAQQCGWLKDRFGLSWQVVPRELPDLLQRSPRVMEAVLQMKKIDLAALREAAGS